ncbi:MAG: dTDP-4-dehydrorhamnose reductase [bacterium]
MKILITGAKGQMGNEFQVLSKQDNSNQLLFTDIDELDITNAKAVSAFLTVEKPDVLINCAGYTAVDKAEQEPEKAFLINGTAVEILAKAVSLSNTLLIHISTDYVFNGNSNIPYREEDSPGPISVYARSKYEGERAVEKYAKRGIIIRTSWLYSAFGQNFVKTILKYGIERGTLRVVVDQIGSPTYARDLCKAILDILPVLGKHQGVQVFHFANEGLASWFDFAKAIVGFAGIPCEVYPIETRDYPLPATRPFYSVLNKEKIKATFGLTIPYWRDSLQDCIHMFEKVDPKVISRAQAWLEGTFDEETKARVNDLLEDDPAELTDAFYRDLEFGTGGLRGIMGVGTNRMNKYTVGMATQGLANYLKKMFREVPQIRMAISYDSRNNSQFFAQITAEVLAGNGFLVYLFRELRPTPELSFAIRHLGCQSGVMITASHNPKEYNGYKAYWDDGAQMIAPHDINVIQEVQKITSIDQVIWQGNSGNILTIGDEMDEVYLNKILELRLSPEIMERQKKLKIVYTPLHGTGQTLVPVILSRFGFTNVTVVQEQAVPDGNFPTVHSPNPEEPDALDLAIKLATQTDAELVMATDPDADRVGIAVKNDQGEFILLNGNQTASLLFYYILTRWKELGKLTGREYIVKTIVTTELLRDIARSFNVEYYDVLTGFKFIADIIKKNEQEKTFIVGGEESYGYLVGDFVRDKDAVSACAMIAETAAWVADQGKSLFDLLMEIYTGFAYYKESLLSVTKKGKSGAEEIQELMIGYRERPMTSINGIRVTGLKDYLTLEDKDLILGTSKPIHLPKSNVLQFILEDGSVISVRPSGTEPKIKYYFGVRESLQDRSYYNQVDEILQEKINGIIRSLNLQ